MIRPATTCLTIALLAGGCQDNRPRQKAEQPPALADIDASDESAADGGRGQIRAHSVDAEPPPVRQASPPSPPPAREPDAAPAAEDQPDAAVPPPEVHVALECPPLLDAPPPDERCNYLDDDGDGRVDEGLAYEILGRPLPLARIRWASSGSYRIVWTGDGFGVSWVSRGGRLRHAGRRRATPRAAALPAARPEPPG